MHKSIHPTTRRGISLLEILISMFVLMIGLMGVASLFPVGGFYMAKGERYDRGAVMAEQALDELRTRGMLRPEYWAYAGFPPFVEDGATLPHVPHLVHPTTEPLEAGTFNVDLSNFSQLEVGRAFVLDPMGAATAIFDAGLTDAWVFPYWDLDAANVHFAMPNEWQGNLTTNPVGYPQNNWPIRRITVNDAIGAMSTSTAETIFRLRDELAVELPEDGDQPARQLWELDKTGTATDPRLTREWQGNYSWLATVVPSSTDGIAALQPTDNGYGSTFYEVSVAVIYKRDTTIDPTLGRENPERSIRAELNIGGELVLFGPDRQTVDAAVKDVRPGEWIAVAGINQSNGDFLLRWYRLLSLDTETENPNDSDYIDPGLLNAPSNPAYRRAMLDGPEWPPPPGGAVAVINLRAIIIPGVTTVATQALPMERQSLWSSE